MDKLIEFIKSQGGRIGVSFYKDDPEKPWFVAVEFGEETKGSSMMAGASYGSGATFEEALAFVKKECHIED